MSRVLSGIQPSGQLHLGNYAGAIRQFLDLQAQGHELFVFVASYHALTSMRDAAALTGNIRQVVIDYLAYGLDPAKTSPTQFYQFWINVDDAGVGDYLKIYTLLNKDEIETLLAEHTANPSVRAAQRELAAAVTELVHGSEAAHSAAAVTEYLTAKRSIADISDADLAILRGEITTYTTAATADIAECLVATGLASSASDARRLLSANAISVNGVKSSAANLSQASFENGRLLLRRGKAFKDTALIELSAS